MTDQINADIRDNAKARGRFMARLVTFRAAQAALALCGERAPDGAYDSTAVLFHEGEIEAYSDAENAAAMALLTTPAENAEQLGEKLAIFALLTDPRNGCSPSDAIARKSVMDDVDRLLRVFATDDPALAA